MAELAQQEGRDACLPEQGRVKNVKNKWVVYEDQAMAHVMQQEEFEHKYGINKYHRRTVRQDIPVARSVESDEKEIWQQEEMQRLERQKQLTDQDAQIARRMADNLQLQEDTEHLHRQHADETQTRELLAKEDATMRHDEELAKQMQEHEKQKFERKRLERERRKLEQQIATDCSKADQVLSQYRKEVPNSHHDNQHNIATESLQNGEQLPERLLRVDGKVEDLGDFTDFYNIPETEGELNRKVLQELQDEELAHLLQEQEHKRGGQLNMDTLKAIEVRDAELARVMQEQEKLKERKRKQKRIAQKQASEHQQHASPGHADDDKYEREPFHGPGPNDTR